MKKFDLLFILLLSAFFAFSCSSNDDDEELTDTGWNGSSQGDDSTDTLPDAITNDDDKTDTAHESNDSDTSEKDDSDTSDSDTSDTGITDNDIPENTDDSGDSEPDEDNTDSTDDSDTEITDSDTDSGDSEPDDDPDTTPEQPALPECSPSSAKPCILGNLIWSNINSKNIKWAEAASHCNDLTEGGFHDWRMPTISELRTLVQNCNKTATGGLCNVTDECTSSSSTANPRCYNIDVCTSTTNAVGIERCGDKTDGFYSKLGDGALYLWSSTTSNDAGDMVWFIYFKNTNITAQKKTMTGMVRCVRKDK